MNNPKISIIVPVYKAEKYLRRCLDSIQQQTFTDWECILVDDGSPDKSGAICDEYASKDSRFRVFHKENGGVSSARNLGLDNAKGEWITFSDADDWLSVDAFENYLKAAADECADVIKAGYTYHRPDGTINPRTCKLTIIVSGGTSMLDTMERTRYFGYLWNSLFRKSVINESRFAKNISWCEDHLFSLICYKKSRKIKFCPFNAYNYRESVGESLSFPTNPYMIADVAEMELNAKLDLIDKEDSDVIIDAWYQYYRKINKAMNLSMKNLRLSKDFYNYTKNNIRETDKFKINPVLAFFYSRLIPHFLKYFTIQSFHRIINIIS